ncbi:hypothetical protein BS639_01535 [Rouxiella silvae]|uniref:Arabinose operon regulatory protein n=1 Tax=Rouxiella silvae TaxID=1646373 RepID=A0AA41BYJ4_9GAMM|nr:helix-turn-helix transcriptional regulator [Rouxiella silvae]KQN42913.1 hypothetical protein ASE93_19670 [Serratia sp. Leaf50]MBF6639211.1 helix-turn-helix transcriptional regulator [Rouxiella silvae]ORJ23058.1 hypothetical protein BS639_01535 [Rouxiella silvae]
MDKIWRKGYGLEYPVSSPIMRVRVQPYATNTRESWHAHEAAQLLYCTTGVLRVLTPEASWTLGPYRAIWIAPDIAHEFHALGHTHTFSLYLDPHTARQFGPVCRSMKVSILQHELILSLQQALECTPSNAARFALIAPLLLDEFKNPPPSSVCSLPLPTDRRLRNICELMLVAPDNNATLEAWGTQVGASSRTLARLFRDQTGMTFAKWRQQLRLAEAVSQLAQGSNVIKIAEQLGYQSPSAFISMFKKSLGETPQRYLRN